VTPAKVLVCHNHYAQPGGEGLVFENLVRGLRQQGHQVVTYTTDNTAIDSMSIRAKAQLLLSAYYSGRTERELTHLVATERPDVAIVQNVFPLISPSAYTTLQALDVPIIQATYNYRFVCPAGELYSHGEICERCLHGNHVHCVVRRCYRDSAVMSAWYASIIGWHRWHGTFARTVDVFQVPDQFMADKLAEGGLPAAKMVKNVNPFFVRDHAATTTHDGYIAFVGRLVRHKGVLTLLEAVRSSPGTRLVVVGRGESEAAMREFVQSQGLDDRVEFTGPLWGDRLQTILARACAVAVPSEWYDNLPLALCQANAHGTPVLASRINGIPEYVHDNVNGLLFTPGHAQELAVLMERMLSLSAPEYAALASRTRLFAEQRLDFEQHYRVLSGVFDRVCRSDESSRR
jgi:glycosyltransferase involved in cell wall biosynthesis